MTTLRTALLADRRWHLAAAAAPALAQKGLDEPFQGAVQGSARRQDGGLRAGRDEFRSDRGLVRRPQEGARALGVKVNVRDPNWSTNAGAQAVTTLISEKPAVMIIHNPDVQTYAKLLQRAENEGIYVVQINMGSRLSQLGLRRRQLDRDRRDATPRPS